MDTVNQRSRKKANKEEEREEEKEKKMIKKRKKGKLLGKQDPDKKYMRAWRYKGETPDPDRQPQLSCRGPRMQNHPQRCSSLGHGLCLDQDSGMLPILDWRL